MVRRTRKTIVRVQVTGQ